MVKLQNFGSYKELELPISNSGLTLIQGPTGAGKSTLCDAIPWVLFGTTAKGGKVDEIKKWDSKEDTIGTVTIDLHGGRNLVATRIRGKTNDFYYVYDGRQIRGKDLVDTQRQFNKTLGLSPNLYLSGAYFHEFSLTANFFTTTTKSRREISEELVDLSLAVQLTASIKAALALAEATVAAYATDLASLQTSNKMLIAQLERNTANKTAWEVQYRKQLADLTTKHNTFAETQAKEIEKLGNKINLFESNKLAKQQELEDKLKVAEALIGHNHDNTKCKECGSISEAAQKLQLKSELARQDFTRLTNQLKELRTATNPYQEQLDKEYVRENTYAQQLETFKAINNPYLAEIKEISAQLKANEVQIKADKEGCQEAEIEVADLKQLKEVLASFRSTLVRNTIAQLQSSTNDRLVKYFDAELRVGLEIQDSDKLEVEIFKDGNLCSFTQLSKGQRQLLKLCFGISVMEAVQEHQGVSFNCVFFDEALDGLDSQFKTKAFQMLKTLETKYPNVYVVEHSTEFKALADNQISVKLENGSSVLE